MYFEPKPKTKREDLFGANYALTTILKALAEASTRLIVIKGLRRVGKTSLLNVALAESKSPSLKIDIRDSPFYDKREFFLYLINSLEQQIGKSFFHKVIESISGMGIRYQEFSIELFFSQEKNSSLFFKKLNENLAQNKKELILAFDEAQLLKAIKFDYVLASIFDNYSQIKIILSGSEIGLLDKFLGKRDYDSPLYGRACLEINLAKLKDEETRQFLEWGFAQIGKKIAFEEIQEVIAELDGIIGWATYYGWLRKGGLSHSKALEEVKLKGQELTRREWEQFLHSRKAKAKYLRVLKSITHGRNTWVEIKYNFQKDRIKITDSQLELYLKELLDYGFIEKEAEVYRISDPLLMAALKR